MTDEDRDRLASILESILFAAGEPLTLARIADAVGEWDRKEVRQALADLGAGYEEAGRGIHLVEVAGGYQLRTAGANAPYVRKALARPPARLTRVALETLAIVAYQQPVTRAEIEAIRGVSDAASVLQTLLERRLLRVAGRKEVVGRPLLYATTDTFLEVFGLKGLGDLPTLGELHVAVDRLEKIAETVSGAAIEEETPDDAIPEGGDPASGDDAEPEAPPAADGDRSP